MEHFPQVTGVEAPQSSFEKYRAAAEAVETAVEEKLQELNLNTSQFVCPSGEVAACANERDREIADRQARLEAVREVVTLVEGVDARQELLAKKYAELIEREADVMIRQAEWAAIKGELQNANQNEAPTNETDDNRLAS